MQSLIRLNSKNKKGTFQVYRGKPYDKTGLIYMGARYYDPACGQFIRQDPYGHTSNTDLHSYANGDPINYFDPDGRLFQPALQKTKATIVNTWNDPRVQGTLMAAGGLAEVGIGLGMSSTGIGAVGGTLIGAHGLDNIQSAVRQIFTGRHTHSIVENIMQGHGMSAENSVMANVYLGMLTPFGMIKATSVSLPRVALANERSFAVDSKLSAKTVPNPHTSHIVKTTEIAHYYPPNNGFLGTQTRKFLMPDTLIDRIGGNDGYFFSIVGTPIKARSLPFKNGQDTTARIFRVLKPFEVEHGIIAPAFGQSGLGEQFLGPVKLRILIKRGFLEELQP